MPHAGHVLVAGVRVTHPERVLFDEMGVTKEALARYYESVAGHILPELRERNAEKHHLLALARERE